MADHTPPPPHAFVLQPMVHVDDMPASIAFYERLGGSIVHGGPDTEWVLMQLGTIQIGLLADALRRTDGESAVELNFLCTTPLDQLEKQLHHRGVTVTSMVVDRTFGNQLHVQSPDGLLIKINEMEPVPLL